MCAKEELALIKTLKRVTVGIALLTAVSIGGPAFAQGEEATVRVAHLSPDAPNVDVYVNDKPIRELAGIPFKAVTPYLPLSAGTSNVKIYASEDTSEPIIEADVDLQSGAAYTIGVVGLVEGESLTTQVYRDDNSLPEQGNAKLRAVHAVPDVAPVDISPQGGEPLFTDLGFPNATRYVEVPAGDYTLAAKATGTELAAFEIPQAPLPKGVVCSAFVVGLAENGTLEVIVAKDAGTSGESGEMQQVASLNVVPGAMPTASAPETGGVSPELLLRFAAILMFAAGLLTFFCGKVLQLKAR